MKLKEFHVLAWQKFVENCLSVKVWVIFTYMGLTLWLTLTGKMDGATFAQTNAAIIGTVLAIREGIKVTRIKANGKNGNGNGEEEQHKVAKFQV